MVLVVKAEQQRNSLISVTMTWLISKLAKDCLATRQTSSLLI